jgi:hypothetical protein
MAKNEARRACGGASEFLGYFSAARMPSVVAEVAHAVMHSLLRFKGMPYTACI